MLKWVKEPDEEYNQESCTYKSNKLVIFSNKDGSSWAYEINKEGPSFGFSSKEEAKKAAIEEVDSDA